MKKKEAKREEQRIVERVQAALDERDVTVSGDLGVESVDVTIAGAESEREMLSKDVADELIEVLEDELDGGCEVYWVSERDIIGSQHGQSRTGSGYVKVRLQLEDSIEEESDEEDAPWRDPDIGEHPPLTRDSDSYTVAWRVRYPDQRGDDYYFSREDAGRRMEWYCEERRDELDWEWEVIGNSIHAEAENDDGELEMVICGPIQIFHEGKGSP
ncbi:hypothetical protein OB919_02575 [Halobacteria archaeon AArc-curdl1]|uniref:Uncharacterized protein n=1 Tax=Natronosalvus hydrolyticus TaxID=2979988 RepID=A0AAP2Z7N3_9EURY|nr:hypothetical protein [Halobacteria archaeon AArc-curdl1]